MVSNGQVMDNQRQQYIPGPPPPPAQPHPMHQHLPPPPPRLHPQNVLPPPPPGPHPNSLPPGTVYGIPGGWQQSWGRPGAFPPPPPIVNHNQAQNQHLGYGTNQFSQQRQPGVNIPPPPPQYDKPILSATFIPGGDSFGPGVGIPPLEDYASYLRYENELASESSRSYSEQKPADGHGNTHSYSYPAPGSSPGESVNREARAASASSNKAPLNMPFRDTPEPLSPGPPTATMQNPLLANINSSLKSTLSVAAGQRQRASSAAVGSTSTSDAASQWPLDRVLIWLAANGFSSDWQETFRILGLQGSDFLELGRGAGGRGNLEKLHQVVYPQLAKVCSSSKTGWDQAREREEGKRMRKLIRRIADNDKAVSAGSGHQRHDSGFIPSASTDGTLENSPDLGRSEYTGLPENSPGKQAPAQLLAGVSARNSVQSRSSTLPVFSKQSSSSSTPSESRHPDSFLGQSRAEHSRNVLSNIGRGRHSPNLSGDASTGLTTRRVENSPSGSPALGNVVPTSANSTSSASSNVQTRSEHTRGNSTESISKGSGYPRSSAPTESSRTSSGLDTPASGRFYENRRDGQEMSRPNPWSNEHGPGPGGKDQSKGFLSKFMNRKKTDTTQPVPEDQLGESPTSPAPYRTMFPFTNQRSNASEPVLVARPSSASAATEEDRSAMRYRSGTRTSLAKRFILATPDHWNYRLIDVTNIESARELRSVICAELGVEDTEFAQIFVTEPGQMDHQSPLTDEMLTSTRRTRSDHTGALKFFVRSSASSAASLPVPQSNGLNLSYAQRRAQPGAEPMIKAYSAGGSGYAAQPTLSLNGDADENVNREAILQRAAEDFRRESERKQKAYLESRQQRKDSTSPYPDGGFRGSRIIDFDSPRLSPFEEKKQETLVPVRRPPTAPSESTTLTKVNSLSKKSGERIRISGVDALKRMSNPIAEEPNSDRGRKRAAGVTPSLAQDIGAALVKVGAMAGAQALVGSQGSTQPDPPQRALSSVDFSQRGNSPGGSPRPDFTWGKGNMLFKVPDYEEGEEERSRSQGQFDRPQNAAVENLRHLGHSPAVSPSAEYPQRPPFVSRPSHGPNNEFKETNVSFAASPNPQLRNDSDDDSDEGLFAIPLTNKSMPKNGLGDLNSREPRPALTVDTENQTRKARVVTFKSPGSSGSGSAGPSNHRRNTDDSGSISEPSAVDRSYSDGSASFTGSAISPDDKMMGRRDSFVSDIWANRPAVENVVDHLDEFFPGVDLDKPYLEEKNDAASSTATPSGTEKLFDGLPMSLRGRVTYGTDGLPLEFTKNESDTLGSDESTLKAKDRDTVTSVAQGSVAQRQIGKSTGLGRMKSIREVARGRNDISRVPSTSAYTQQTRGNGLLRRKSTKMFGANIVQIKPKPGNRVSMLDPIPQEEVPTEETPKRQATFKIIRGQLIGKGTYGRVYLGMNATTGEFLAVKQVEVNQKVAGQDKDRIKEMVAALDQEIDTMQHLEHSNIVQYLGCERKEFSISIYLEYIPGGSVGSCLRKHGKFEESVVRSLTRQTLEGLSYLHEQGILHRDLKADNILLDLDGSCKISDFGISKKSDNIYGNDITNSMQGSVFWMAPEVVRSQGTGYSAKVDIWSLGCVVLEMFAGKRPWSREEAIGAIFKLGSLNQAPPIPEDVQQSASIDGLNFMYDCFQIDPSDRPTAVTLLHHSRFCIPDPYYNFYDTTLAEKLRISGATAIPG